MPISKHSARFARRTAGCRLGNLLLGLAILLSACGTFEVGLVPTPTATPSMLRYENTAYGFAFTYPSAWTVSETPHKALVHKGTWVLSIGYKRVDEAEEIGADLGIPTQGTVYIQKLTFLGQTMPAVATLYGRKIKAVTYDAPRPVTREDLAFAINLTDAAGGSSGDAYAAIDIPDTVLEEAKRILESFERLPTTGASTTRESDAAAQGTDLAYPTPTLQPGWARYVNAGYGFAFSYPASWQLTQQAGGEATRFGPLADAVVLTQGDIALTVQVQRTGETHYLGAGDPAAGQVVTRQSVSFMGERVDQRVLTFQGEAKQMSFRYEGGDLEFFIILTQTPGSTVAYEDFALSESIQEEAAAILASFTSYPPA